MTREPSKKPHRRKNIASNRRARFNFEILDTIEAGIVLTGTEIKAIREGRVNLSESYARPIKGELWLLNAHVAQYSPGAGNNHDPTRQRKLLLHKAQLHRLSRSVLSKGLTLVPLRMYFKGHYVKIELGLAKGKRNYDKRQSIMEREREREARQAIGRQLKHSTL